MGVALGLGRGRRFKKRKLLGNAHFREVIALLEAAGFTVLDKTCLKQTVDEFYPQGDPNLWSRTLITDGQLDTADFTTLNISCLAQSTITFES